MCTLTIVPQADGIRIACNRDESRLRPVALPPQKRKFGTHLALLPIDPVSDGTWIGASDAGLVLVLMNVYYRSATGEPVVALQTDPTPRVSRGSIIPAVLSANGLRDALSRVEALELGQFDPFRLVLADRGQWATVEWARSKLQSHSPETIARPMFFTSSGLGDEIVLPRQRLFDELLTTMNPADWPQAQDAFHHFEWPDNPYASVWMTRREAMTVSHTRVELSGDKVRMCYFARQGDTAESMAAEPLALPLIESA